MVGVLAGEAYGGVLAGEAHGGGLIIFKVVVGSQVGVLGTRSSADRAFLEQPESARESSHSI